MMRRRVIAAGVAAAALGASAVLAPGLLSVGAVALVAFALERLRVRFAPPPVYDLPVCAYRVMLWFRTLGR